MDKTTTDIIFFLQYWDKKNPTLEDQTSFMLSEMFEEDECLFGLPMSDFSYPNIGERRLYRLLSYPLMICV